MRIYHVFFISIALAFTSCVTILQSLVTPDNIISDNRIEGLWTGSDSKPILVQKLLDSKFKNIFDEARADHKKISLKDSVFYTKLYIISYREKDLNYIWIAGLVKINDQYYLNLQPEQCMDDHGTEVDNPGKETSSIAKLEWKGKDAVTLNFLNGDKIKEIILNGKAQIKYEFDPLFESFVITASSGELALFLERYGYNERLVKGGHVITFKRKN